MTAATLNVPADRDLRLSEAEINLLLRAMFRECARHIFAFLRASEFTGWRPAEREAQASYAALSRMLACAEFANQILKHCVQNEYHAYIHDGAEDDERFIEVSEVLRGFDYAPLIAEVPENAAFTLWFIVGSWSGAAELCGLELLPKEQKQRRAKLYATSHASPEFLPERVLAKLPPERLAQLQELCEEVRRRGNFLEEDRKTEKTFRAMGVSLVAMGVTSTKKRKGTEAHRWAVDGWMRSGRGYRGTKPRTTQEKPKKKK
jgi:hypothetical protein